MKNEKLDEFLYKNRLKSSDLVEFWGVTKGVVSQILNGTTKLPTKRLEELLNNDQGWDTSMLTSNQPEVPAEEKPTSENSLLEYLQRKIEKLEREKEELLHQGRAGSGKTHKEVQRKESSPLYRRQRALQALP